MGNSAQSDRLAFTARVATTLANLFEKNECLLVASLTIASISIPFLALANWLPAVDMPQHLAQARLAGKVLLGDEPGMMINWLSPNTLTTWILALLLVMAPPLIAAKIIAFALLALSALGIALLARKIGANSAVVPLSATLLFNQSFYWGFLPFMAGFATFLFLVTAWINPTLPSKRSIIPLALLFLLTYLGHILWFASAILTVLIIALASRERKKKLWLMALSLLPAIALIFFWRLSIQNTWQHAWLNIPPSWFTPISERLHPIFAANVIYGIKTEAQWLLLAIIVIFILGGIGRAIRKRSQLVSTPLIMAATILLTAYLLLPDAYSSTILFSARWLPYALILFLLGLTAPISVKKWESGILFFAVLTLAGYTTLTASTWKKVEENELSGLMQSMEKLPVNQNVLGLSFIKTSALLTTIRPYIQTAAYAQVLKDCITDFSFAEHASSLVTYKNKHTSNYKTGIDWVRERQDNRNDGFFSHALINADDATHDSLPMLLGLKPLTLEGRWRLYAIE